MLKKDEYVRTKQGTIGQIIEKYEKYCVIANTRGEIDVPYENITKHSKNIIDLIETGDYVNGGKVVEHAHEKGRLFVTFVYVGGKGFTTFEDYSWELKEDEEENIETIVTKEQFSNMEYKL